MCARYTLTVEQARLVLAGLIHIFAFAPRYNIGPTRRVPIIRFSSAADTNDGIQCLQSEEMTWGFKPVWSKTLLINAQSERITEAATFKPLLHQRCLVPMDGFYEWKPDKSPVRFVRPDRAVFYVAALWKAAERPANENAGDVPQPVTFNLQLSTASPAPIASFVLLTRSATADVKPIHTRMPFIVRPDQMEPWLGNGRDPGPIDEMLRAPDTTPLEFYPVSREVNDVRKESPDLITPIPEERELF